MVDAESVPSAGLVAATQVIPENEPGRGDLIGPLDIFKILPVEPSDRLGWVGLEAVRYRGYGGKRQEGYRCFGRSRRLSYGCQALRDCIR